MSPNMHPNTVRHLLAMRTSPPPAPVPDPRWDDLLDWVETRLWTDRDARLLAAGWAVVRLGRWQRQYRHPELMARTRA